MGSMILRHYNDYSVLAAWVQFIDHLYISPRVYRTKRNSTTVMFYIYTRDKNMKKLKEIGRAYVKVARGDLLDEQH